MDNIVPDGFSSCYNRKSKKCQRDAIQAQLVKEQKLIDKGENVCTREMGKDQERVRKCLEKLENDKKKFCRDFEPSRGNSPFPFHDDRAHSRGSFRPLSGYDVKSQSRSRRQLQEAGATSMDLKRASSRRSFEQGSVSPEHPKGRQRSNSLSLPSPGKKVTHGLRNMPSVENGKALPDGAIPSIILTEEDCKEPSILYLSPNAKSTANIASVTQGSESDGSNKENRASMNQDHPARHGFREHKPSTKEKPTQESSVTKEKPKSDSHASKDITKHDHHATRDKHDSHVAKDNTKHDSHAHVHHVKEKHTSHGAHDHHGNAHGAHTKHDNHEHDRHHGARAKHGHHDNTGSHDQHKPHHHHHGSRPILKDHHDSQSGLSSLRDSRHGQHDSAHHSHSPRESSRQSHILENRRSSLAGQPRRIAIENNMEEAQNLYELALRSVADAHHKPTMPNVQGRRGSLPGERRGSLPGALPGERRVSLSSDKPSLLTLPDHIPNLSMLDKSAMDDLQELLHEVRIYRDRKTSEDQGHCHSQSRNQRKRLEHIEAILEKLSRHSATKFDPQEMLACGYLRLSKHNIETLENMIKDSGQDPGIHAHSDVREYDLWADIKRENELEQDAAHAPSVSPTKKIKG